MKCTPYFLQYVRKGKAMKLALAIAASLCVSSAAAAKDTYVKPYVKADGTYVQGHYKTSPNGTRLDNYSTSPNYNPYTGRQGTVNPYAPPRVPEYRPQTYTPPKPKPYGYKPRGY